MLFISHRTADKAAAEDLKRRALARGYSAEQLFLDSDPVAGIAAGADWEHVIYDRLKQCQALIVVCSPRWAESKWCFAELVFAKSLGKLVFPVVTEECVIDAILGERQSVFVFKDGEAAYERLWKSPGLLAFCKRVLRANSAAKPRRLPSSKRWTRGVTGLHRSRTGFVRR